MVMQLYKIACMLTTCLFVRVFGKVHQVCCPKSGRDSYPIQVGRVG